MWNQNILYKCRQKKTRVLLHSVANANRLKVTSQCICLLLNCFFTAILIIFPSFSPSQVSVQWTGTPSTTCCHVMGREMLWSSLSEEQPSLCSALRAWILWPWRTVKALWGWPYRKGELAAQHSDTRTHAVTATKHSLDKICFEHESIILRAVVAHWNE